jgi:hypothetical protein
MKRVADDVRHLPRSYFPLHALAPFVKRSVRQGLASTGWEIATSIQEVFVETTVPRTLCFGQRLANWRIGIT